MRRGGFVSATTPRTGYSKNKKLREISLWNLLTHQSLYHIYVPVSYIHNMIHIHMYSYVCMYILPKRFNLRYVVHVSTKLSEGCSFDAGSPLLAWRNLLNVRHTNHPMKTRQSHYSDFQQEEIHKLHHQTANYVGCALGFWMMITKSFHL